MFLRISFAVSGKCRRKFRGNSSHPLAFKLEKRKLWTLEKTISEIRRIES